MARNLPLVGVRTRKNRYGASPTAGLRGGSLKTPVARRLRTIASLVGLLGVFAASPGAGTPLGSPLGFPPREDAAVRRAAQAGERVLDLDRARLALLRQVGRGQAVRLERFPFAPGATGDLVLERFEVATPDARVFVQTERGEESFPMPDVAHFRGRLEGDPDSNVYVGAQASFLVAIVRTSAGLFYLGPDGPVEGSAQHVMRKSDSPLVDELAPIGWSCDADELPPTPADLQPVSGGPSVRPASVATSLAAATLRDAQISIETDQEFLARFAGDVTAMSAYVTTLLGQISTIYERDTAVHLTINRIQAWTTTDPYAASDPMGQLNEVGDWWHANRPRASYPRAVVHFMSGKPVTGGIAWLDVLCQSDFSQGGHWGGGYGVTQVYGNYPANLWDLLAIAHELGHNFGTPHTHCFSPPLDQCYGGEGGCYSGPSVNPGPLGGTIMSYCHLLVGGYGNVDLRFHERCITEEMLPEINSVSCLTTLTEPAQVATSFYTVAPCRLVDTRDPTGPYGGPALSANTTRSFAVGGRCGIPATAKSISLNVVVAQAEALGNLRLYATGTQIPSASAINYRAGQTRSNNGFARLGSAAGLDVRCDQPSGNAHVIIDVNGYYQ